MQIDIKYFDDGIEKIKKIDKGDWIDLRCVGVSKVYTMNRIDKDLDGNKILTRDSVKVELEWEDGTFYEAGNSMDVKFIRYNKGDYLMLDLGIAMQLPAGYEAYVIPRGSTFKNFSIIETNSMGIVDNSYRGDNDKWFMPALAMNDGFIIYNERVCQFRVQERMRPITFNEKEKFYSRDRGAHGSSGTR